MLIKIHPYDVEVWRPRVEHLLQIAANRSRGKETVAYYLSQAGRDKMQLWVYVNAQDVVLMAMLTGFVYYPGYRAVRGVAMAGEMLPEWLAETAKTIEQWAISQGCGGIECITRPGMARGLRELGYTETHRIFEKALLEA